MVSGPSSSSSLESSFCSPWHWGSSGAGRFAPARAREQHPPTSYASAIAVFLFGLVLMVIGLAIGLAVGLTDTLVATFIVVGALFALVGAPLYALGIRWGISK